MEQPGQGPVSGGRCCPGHLERTVGAGGGLGEGQSLDSATSKAVLAGLKLEWAWAEGSPTGIQ